MEDIAFGAIGELMAEALSPACSVATGASGGRREFGAILISLSPGERLTRALQGAAGRAHQLDPHLDAWLAPAIAALEVGGLQMSFFFLLFFFFSSRRIPLRQSSWSGRPLCCSWFCWCGDGLRWRPVCPTTFPIFGRLFLNCRAAIGPGKAATCF